MKEKYVSREDVRRLIQKRHEKGLIFLDNEGVWRQNGSGQHSWQVPYGVRVAMHSQLIHAQIVNKYPWMATWVSPKTGKRLKKKFMSLPAAISFVATKAQYVDPDASVYSRHGFYIPTKLMGKFPRKGKTGKTYYWCPRCMQPRKFRRNGEEFHAQKKFWSDEKGRYIWKDVRLAVICCSHCGISNRDHIFRASNQPVEHRKFKQGVRRARKRRRRARG